MRYTISFRALWTILAVFTTLDVVWILATPSLPDWFAPGNLDWLRKDAHVAWFLLGSWWISGVKSPPQSGGAE